MLYTILNFVKKYLDVGKSLSDAFRDFATQHGYTPKSVKKCFLSTLAGLKSHPNLVKKFDIDLNQLSDPANVFNMSAVKNYVTTNGGDTDKCFYALCFGDINEAIALKKRFEKFFPDFCPKQTEERPAQPDFALSLQAKYYGLDSTTRLNA